MKPGCSGRALLFAVLWAISVAAAGVVGSAAARQRVEPGPPMSGSEDQLVTGEDVGFAIRGVGKGNVRVGTLMVRVDGQWVRAELAPEWRVRPVQ